MINEDYIGFETAKLLKEKGFDWDWSPFYCEQDRDEWRQNNYYTIPNPIYDPNLPFDTEILTAIAPHVSIQMTMKWLREVHNILLVIDYDYECTSKSYYYKIYHLGKNGKPERFPIYGERYDEEGNSHIELISYRDYERSNSEYATYKEAAEAGIKYCLEKI